MNCPTCKDKPMITLELNEVEVDYCLECKGIWLDEGELETLLDSTALAIELLDSFQKTQSDEIIHRCPICLKKMEKISVGDSEKQIIIDKCAKNHGLWFGKGELSLILEKASLDKESKIQKLLKEIFTQD
jgi:Zn-finger nucleic acid-binding protein